MSERERSLVETLGKLPDALQDEFLAMAKGAVMMQNAMGAATPDTGEAATEKGG